MHIMSFLICSSFCSQDRAFVYVLCSISGLYWKYRGDLLAYFYCRLVGINFNLRKRSLWHCVASSEISCCRRFHFHHGKFCLIFASFLPRFTTIFPRFTHFFNNRLLVVIPLAIFYWSGQKLPPDWRLNRLVWVWLVGISYLKVGLRFSLKIQFCSQ